MRKSLDRLYDFSGYLAAFFLCAIVAIVLAQVCLNAADKILGIIAGRAVGLVIPSYAEFAGYFLASATFLAMAYALRRGAHIRVNLLVMHLSEGRRRFVELFSAGLAALFCVYITYYIALLVYESYHFGDISPGMVPVRIWIPQVPVLVGFVVLTISFLDIFVQILRGEPLQYIVQGAGTERFGAERTDNNMLSDGSRSATGKAETSDDNSDRGGG